MTDTAPGNRTRRRALVTGGAGEIGARLVAQLAARGFAVRAMALCGDRSVARLNGVPCEIVAGDICNAVDARRALMNVDVVYHLAAVLLTEDRALFERVNVQGTRTAVVEASRAGVQHFIHISSASVVYPKTTPYSRSKRAGERIVREAARMPYTIVRPTLVYDGDGGLEFRMFAAHARRFPVIPLVGRGQAKKRPIHVDDLLAGLLAIADDPVTFGKTYALCGSETITIRELAQLLSRPRSDGEKAVVAIPEALCRAFGALFGKLTGRANLVTHTLAGLTQDADLDNSTALHDLDFHPRGIRDGLALCGSRVQGRARR